MSYGRYGSRWGEKNTATRTPSGTPLKPGIDVQHSRPSPNPNMPARESWQGPPVAPGLPADVMGETPNLHVVPTGGPVEHIPRDPMQGLGGGHGLSIMAAQNLRGEVHSMDDGSVPARRWQPSTYRDGTPGIAYIPDMEPSGDSPQTVRLQATGVGVEHDPNARRAGRFKRWWDRTIDMHRYQVELRPRTGRYAVTAPSRPADPTGTHLSTPFGNVVENNMSTMDKWVVPQLRRAPQPYDNPVTVDGSEALMPQHLAKWGL